MRESCTSVCLWELTYDSIGLRSKGTHARGARGDLELWEAPLGAEVLGKKAGGCQAADRGTHRVSLPWSQQRRNVSLQPTTDLDCLFLFGSSAAKMWTVPWSLDTQMRDASWLKLMLDRTEQMDIMRLFNRCFCTNNCGSQTFIVKIHRSSMQPSYMLITQIHATLLSSPVNVGCLRASSQLLYKLTRRRVENPYERALWKRDMR